MAAGSDEKQPSMSCLSTTEIADRLFTGHAADVLCRFPDGCIDLVITSPPYWTAVEYDQGGNPWSSYEGYLTDMQSIWSQCDYYQHHDYPSDLITGLQDGPVIPAGDPAKPIYAGECGRDFTPFLGLHAPLWAGLMAGQSGAGQQWYSDQLEAENAYSLYKAGRDFVLLSGLGEQDAVGKSVLHVTCPIIGSGCANPTT